MFFDRETDLGETIMYIGCCRPASKYMPRLLGVAGEGSRSVRATGACVPWVSIGTSSVRRIYLVLAIRGEGTQVENRPRGHWRAARKIRTHTQASRNNLGVLLPCWGQNCPQRRMARAGRRGKGEIRAAAAAAWLSRSLRWECSSNLTMR